MKNPFKKREFIQPIGACFPEARLAEAWTPYQGFCMIFEPATGLHYGTVFPELVRPYVPHPHTPKWY